MEKKQIALVQALQKRWGSNLVSVILFGSRARGTADDLSDTDFCLILENLENPEDRLSGVLDIQKKIDPRGLYSFVVLTRSEALQNHPVFLDMTVHSMILFDKDNFFLNRLDQIRKRLRELGAQRVELANGRWYWDLKPDLTFGETFEL